MIVQLIQGVFVEQYDPTLEGTTPNLFIAQHLDSYRKEVTIMDKQYTLDILDTAGKKKLKYHY